MVRRYFHPWEIDPDQPQIKAGFKSTLRHYLNLKKTESKVISLLKQFRFSTMSTVLELDGTPISPLPVASLWK